MQILNFFKVKKNKKLEMEMDTSKEEKNTETKQAIIKENYTDIHNNLKPEYKESKTNKTNVPKQDSPNKVSNINYKILVYQNIFIRRYQF